MVARANDPRDQELGFPITFPAVAFFALVHLVETSSESRNKKKGEGARHKIMHLYYLYN